MVKYTYSAGQLDKVRVSCGARAKHRQDIVSFDHLLKAPL